MADMTINHNYGTKRNYEEPIIWTDWSLKGESIPNAFRQKKGFKGSKTEMSIKMVRFCKVCLLLECVYRTTFYGIMMRNYCSEPQI